VNLSDLLATGPDLVALRGLAIVLSPALHDMLSAVQAQLPDRACVVQALPLADGRWMLGADLLSEIGPGGLYADGFGRLPSSTFSSVEVLPMSEALALRSVETGE
jgi:hypothetical protein